MNESLLTYRTAVEPDTSLPCRHRVRVDGKFFARNGRRLRIQGVTYGPFAPNAEGQPFPEPGRVRQDFMQMGTLGVNAIRTYNMPPSWLLDLASEANLLVLVDIPWAKHLCFLDSDRAMHETRKAMQDAAQQGRCHGCILAYSIGNEIPANIVRWHGAARVERFLAELMDIVKQQDPDGLVTYANYPSTEYLDLSFLDFSTFNVYLHDPTVFRRYLYRLQNLVGEKPLLLGEIGMDTLRAGEEAQAAFLASHLRETTLMGLAGAFVFSWTDDWYTGGHQIEDWTFGITRADRSPKSASHAVAEVFGHSPSALLPETPRVSIVVCSYNGGATLAQCLRSLVTLDYPDYEVILVDDGSTDDSREIAARFPQVRYIYQTNQGLSVARNVGLAAATGSIIAYTDSDCYADPNWLSLLVYPLIRTAAAGVGGPNLTPDDGDLVACVAAAPGQPTHVLENDQTAEHVPGCNMAFRREALEAINGFNPRYRKAGDDVDICWRLQQAGMWITFAPGAFVWHHRRQTPRTYLRQQTGYGEAEALLWFDHPDKFNSLGEGKWRGMMYGAALQGLRIGRPVIYRGVFGSGLFQTLYQPAAAHWAMLPTTLEWHVAALITALAALSSPLLWSVAAGMIGLSIVVACLRAAQAPLAPSYRSLRSRSIIATLCYVQPLARSWRRYRTRLFPPDIPPSARAEPTPTPGDRLPLSGEWTVSYWDEAWRDRTDLLNHVVRHLAAHPWAVRSDSGWSDWDIEIYTHPWTVLQVKTAQEDHGSGKRLIRIRFQLQPSEYARAIRATGITAALFAVGFQALPIAWMALVLLVAYTIVWLHGLSMASQAVAMVESQANEMGLYRCEPSTTRGQRTRQPAAPEKTRAV